MGTIFQYMLIVYLVGLITNFQITGSEFIGKVLNSIESLDNIMSSRYERPLQIIIFNLLLYPVVCLKDLYFLRFGSIGIIGIIIYTVVLISAESPAFIQNEINTDVFTDKIVYFNLSLECFSTFAISIFAFACHVLIFPIRKELARASGNRMGKIIGRAVTLEYVLYNAIAILGYLSILVSVPSLFVFRNGLPGSQDIPMTIAKAALIVSPCVSIPLRTNPARLQFYLLTGIRETTSNRLLLTAVILTISGGIAIVFPNVYAAVTILAGTVGCFINFTVPASIYIIGKPVGSFKRNGAIVVTVLATCGAFTGAIYEFATSI